ncbi:ParB family chromosome partitioning protein [Gracilibacillus halotolerans]|uniref:ParB family chromosome partitioning protein n=1 Tax=Gracilibacillus halotolerans TaxID=74386 RepID=A0A841RLL5_9BACI|nr:ParB/RepB/Spo0J family partition protein [Gracilibacillus halotolerans]MBB6513379.1 ParB family chromosome partitioning protein [Gracilibacillus halotolerans]
MAKGGLGRGLDVYFPQVEEDNMDQVEYIDLKQCRPNPYQPRKVFEADAIEEMKQSIKQHGILQPLIVRKSIRGYEIVVGERRYRAAKEANLETIPAIVKELTDEDMMEIALLENIQREDLTPIEEANAYDKLINELGVTQDQLAKRLGKSRPHIANLVRLLSLPSETIQMINNGSLSMGHGRALLGLKDKTKVVPTARRIVKEKLNVRQVEALIQQLNENTPKQKQKKVEKDIFITEKENHLTEFFGTNVSINRGKKKGKIEIEFFSDDDLNRILSMIEQDKE